MGKNQNISYFKKMSKLIYTFKFEITKFYKKTSRDYKKVHLESRLESQFISNQITNKRTIHNTYLKFFFFNVYH